MRIELITPAPPSSKAGNRATANRWKQMLNALGHQVHIHQCYTGADCDMMIAIHAWRSAESIQRFAEQCAHKPLVVVLSGTDAYEFIHSHAETTLRSIEQSHYLIGLHTNIHKAIPLDQQKKLTVIYQSAEPIQQRNPVKHHFRVCVAGHLREEKDPLRPAYAARSLPENSRIEIVHYGKANTQDWAEQAKAEMQINARYRWFGEIPYHQIRQVYASAHLMVLPSRMEGGANVTSEAIMANLPMLASRIDGNTGLLGEDYPGYFSVADTSELRDLMLRAEQDNEFYQQLRQACCRQRPLFSYHRELESWRNFLKNII